MSEETLERWLLGRVPLLPTPFLPHLLGGEEGLLQSEGCSVASDLATRGTVALGLALERPGRVREAAFQLLAADAFFTYACEAAALEEDVRSGLEGILMRSGDRFR